MVGGGIVAKQRKKNFVRLLITIFLSLLWNVVEVT